MSTGDGARLFLLVVFFALLQLLPSAHEAEPIEHRYSEALASYSKLIASLGNTHKWRCIAESPGSAVDLFRNGALYDASDSSKATLVTTSCLGSDSLGNRLTDYFENLMCSIYTGLNYITVLKTWESGRVHTVAPLLRSLPAMLSHPHPAGFVEANATISSVCTCGISCHERADALWVKGIETIKPIMRIALEEQRRYIEKQHINKSNTLISRVDGHHHSNVQAGTVLPLIPDVAVHYRCGDNFVGQYGFLPFSAFPRLIPANAASIFILAEHRSRHSTAKQYRANKCDVILLKLFEFLCRHFPHAKIAVRRGDDLYTDMVRLAYANVTVCSVSTFCLWSVIARESTSSADIGTIDSSSRSSRNRRRTYVPQSQVLLGGNISVDLGFSWLTEPALLLGKPHDHLPITRFVQLLSRES